MAKVLAQAIDETLRSGGYRPIQGEDPAPAVGRFAVDEERRFDPEPQQAALQRSVVEGVGFLGAQAHALAEFGIAGEHRRRPAGETRLQAVAEPDVKRPPILLLAQPFAVRGIGDQQSGRTGRRFDVGQLAALGANAVRHPGATGVDQRRADRFGVAVAGQDRRDARVAGFPPLDRLGQQAVPQQRDVTQPAGEPPMLAQQAGRVVAGDPGGFDRQGARAAQRIDEGTAGGGDGRPVRFQQQRGGQGFLERSRDGGRAVAAPMQAVPRQVEADGGSTVAGEHMNPQIRPLPVHPRSPVKPGPKAVDDGVLDPLRAVMAVIDAGAGPAKFDGERAVRGQMLLPGKLVDAGVQCLHPGEGKLGQRQQHPAGGARPQAGAISQFQRASETDAAAGRFGIDGAQSAQFRHQQGLDAGRGGGEEGDCFAHGFNPRWQR